MIEVGAELKHMALMLRTQDNRITSSPIFVVQKKVLDYGYSSDFSDKYHWMHQDEGDLASMEKTKWLDSLDESGEVPSQWVKTYYVERWEYVMPFFTEEAADAYIHNNRHHFSEARVFVESGYRNYEWERVRELLMSCTEEA